MATSGSSHSKAFKRLRAVLIRELPEPKTLLDSPELKKKFSPYERSQMLAPHVFCDRAEKLVDVMEFSSSEVFQRFLAALKRLKPELAARLETVVREMDNGPAASSGVSATPQRVMGDNCAASSSANEMCGQGEERLHYPVQEQGQGDRQPQANYQGRGEEDAGIFGLNGFNQPPNHRISYLSYTCREYLASKLNGTPPARNTFHSFCHALGAEDRLIQVSARSVNPTGYFLQKYSSKAEATLENLKHALVEIGMGDVYEHLSEMLEGGGGGPEDN